MISRQDLRRPLRMGRHKPRIVTLRKVSQKREPRELSFSGSEKTFGIPASGVNSDSAR